jgi:hypothetical protein
MKKFADDIHAIDKKLNIIFKNHESKKGN